MFSAIGLYDGFDLKHGGPPLLASRTFTLILPATSREAVSGLAGFAWI
jgi:hypothetical protein